MDSLPKHVYLKMQKLGKVFLSDLGIDINEKNEGIKEHLIIDF